MFLWAWQEDTSGYFASIGRVVTNMQAARARISAPDFHRREESTVRRSWQLLQSASNPAATSQ